MSFEVTADPQRFEEAIDWFSKRTVLTKKETERLGSEAGRRAFWIGGGLQLAQIQRVFDKLGTAIEKGQPFDEWRKSVRSELRDDAHAATVFHNATLRSLNAGRWRQMREPGVLAFRPYWLFDGIRDSRQSRICRKCHGVILPADHPWWATHTPLLHHWCRSSIRNLRRSEAERRGITNVPPVDPADDGFGLSPEGEPEWRPDPKKTDPGLLKELERKAETPRPEPPKPPPGPPREHDPKHWEDEYASYGAAAPAVAWGRTMLERGIDRAPSELVAELKRLRDAGVPGEFGRLRVSLVPFDQNRPLRGQHLTPHQRYAVALAEHSLTIRRGEGVALGGIGATDQRVLEASTFFRELADKSVRRPVGIVAQSTSRARAYFSSHSRLIELGDDGTPVTIHEIAHAIEDTDPRALARSLAFLRFRTKGEKLTSLLGAGGAENELGRRDKFFMGYVGRDYGDAATEITSMGYQAMGGESAFLAALVDPHHGDPEMLWFLLGQLAGR